MIISTTIQAIIEIRRHLKSQGFSDERIEFHLTPSQHDSVRLHFIMVTNGVILADDVEPGESCTFYGCQVTMKEQEAYHVSCGSNSYLYTVNEKGLVVCHYEWIPPIHRLQNNNPDTAG